MKPFAKLNNSIVRSIAFSLLCAAPMIASANPRYTCEVHQYSNWANVQTLTIGKTDPNSAPLLVGPYTVRLTGYPTLEFFITVTDPKIANPEKNLIAQAAGVDGVELSLSAPIIDIDVNCVPVKR